uniref:Unkown protein n=1 Tax=Riptortus pedestris TaxID=329032 RepID=R4WR52_RIPPE|nr:unkown protein [Riptortus pedestris]
MDPLQNAISSRKSSLFKIGDTEVRLIPGSSIFNVIASGTGTMREGRTGCCPLEAVKVIKERGT